MEGAQASHSVTHRKSRNGCIRCKRRRVKCDEKVPCTACIRHRVLCSLINNSTASVQPNSVELQGSQRTEAIRINSLTNPSPLASIQLPLPASDNQDCFVSTSQLMFHWTTEAYRSMGSLESPAAMQVDVPREAMAHPFLLRTLLAFSAFHLAYLDSSQASKYRFIALRHQYLALRGLREALRQATSENCHTLFLSALILVITKFASFPDCPHNQYHTCGAPIQSLLEAFSICAGVRVILDLFKIDITRGPFQFLFHKRVEVNSDTRLPLLVEKLAELEIMAESQPGGKNLSETFQKLTSCSLDVQARSHPSSTPEISCLYAWPMFVPEQFLNLASNRDHSAMSILAHYCVIIHWAGQRFWCFEGCAASLMGEIHSELQGSSWEVALNWPLQMIAEIN